ncbi:MAG: hypothetical protein QM728_04490 [Gordonia sp. (in: high G+C Gram-positive bacteria)]
MDDGQKSRWWWLEAYFTGRFSMWVTYPIVAFAIGFLLAYFRG